MVGGLAVGGWRAVCGRIAGGFAGGWLANLRTVCGRFCGRFADGFAGGLRMAVCGRFALGMRAVCGRIAVGG